MITILALVVLAVTNVILFIYFYVMKKEYGNEIKDLTDNLHKVHNQLNDNLHEISKLNKFISQIIDLSDLKVEKHLLPTGWGFSQWEETIVKKNKYDKKIEELKLEIELQEALKEAEQEEEDE